MVKKLEDPKFPYSLFPFCVRHKDGKELKDTKLCYFQSMNHVDKYVARSKFKAKDYQLFVKAGTNVEDMVPSIRKKRRKN